MVEGWCTCPELDGDVPEDRQNWNVETWKRWKSKTEVEEAVVVDELVMTMMYVYSLLTEYQLQDHAHSTPHRYLPSTHKSVQ